MIRVLDRYFLKRFIGSLIVASSALITVALIVDLVEHLEDIVDNAASAGEVLLYYVYYIPWIYKITIPASVFLAGMFSIGLMARHREVLAMKSAGVSLYRIAAPLLAFTFLLSAANFYFNEEVLPYTIEQRNRIKQGGLEKTAPHQGTILYNLSRQGEGGYIYHFETFRPDRREARNVLVQRFEHDSLTESYRGARMTYLSGRWIIYDGAFRSFAGGQESFERFDSLLLVNCREHPDEFEKYRGKPEDMGYRELAGYIRVLEKTGAPYARELVDLRTKLSFPLTSFIVMFLCIPIAANPRRSGVAMSFSIAAGLSLVYFVVFKITQSLGYSGKLPPEAAAWSINIIFLLVGLVIFFRAHK